MKTLKESILSRSSHSGEEVIYRIQISDWLNENAEIEGKYIINSDHTIDVEGDVSIKRGVMEFPDYIQFNIVYGDFIFGYGGVSLRGCPKIVRGRCFFMQNNFKSLEGAPLEVGGDFICMYCNLKTLKGAPKKVGGDFNCGYNNLTSLKYISDEIGGGVSCRNNELTKLEYLPDTISGHFECQNNYLTTLEGGPRVVKNSYYCYSNKLTTLEGAPVEVDGDFNCSNNDIQSLEGIPEKINGDFYVTYTKKPLFTKDDIRERCTVYGRIGLLSVKSARNRYY